MFKHQFKYTLKTLFKSKSLIFWTYAFPIILGTFFYLAFSNIENSEKLDVIDIAVVETNEYNEDLVYVETFNRLSDDDNEDKMFNIKYVNEDKAKELLNKGKITGYFILKDKPSIYVKENGINETIFKSVVEEINNTKNMINTLSEEKIKGELIKGNQNIDYEKLYNEIISKINNYKSNIQNVSNDNLSYTMIEFYTLIAMACLNGAILSIIAINNVLPNMTGIGKRVGVSPVNKFKLILSSTLASYIVELLGLIILFIYTIFVLKVDYGSNLPLIILLALIGSFAGITLGILVATIFKLNDNAKTGILISFTMLGCFFSGMMGITMKYIIDKNIPIINKLNPANMITDGFYSLYYYDTLDRFYFNVISLLIFSGLMIIISFISLRGQKYDSI
ncbi:MAG: ABC transporter permease [Bacilli bacterium]|nr:ABC transporter permease [Bacilli bacterium]